MTSPDASVQTFPHGHGEGGDMPVAVVEVWWLEGGKVTFGGFPPAGDPGWEAAVWLAIAAEAVRRAGQAAA